MDFAYYRNFAAIVEAGSLTAAARNLNLAQPALSAQLKMLEQSYGAKFLQLRRGVRKLELTDAGRIFYEKAKALCLLEETARLELQNCGDGMSGTLKISLSPAKAPLFVKQYVAPFCRLYPKIHYQIHEVDVNTQAEHILNGITDLAIANAPLPEPHLFKLLLEQKENFIVAAHKDNIWQKKAKKKITLKDLGGQLLCTNFGSYSLIKQALSAQKLSARFVLLSTTRMTALQFAEQNLAITVLPAEQGEALADSLCFWPLAEKRLFLTKTVFVSKNRELSPCAETFLDFYQKEYYKNELQP